MLALAGLALLTGCGASPAGAACPAMAARAGIGLEIEAPLAEKVAKATINGTDIHLDESTRSEPAGCAGNQPDQACSATAVRTGAKNGFLDRHDLKLEQTKVNVRLTGADGVVLVEQDIEVTPKEIFPAGPKCGGGQPQTGVIVAPNGILRVRS